MTAAAAPGPAELLAIAADRWPDAPAVSDATGCDTYAHLARAGRRMAGALHALGVRAGDRVMLRLAGDRQFAAVLYGALHLGATAVPVNPATGPFHLRWMLTDAAPSMLVTAAGEVDRFHAAGLRAIDPGGLDAAGGPDRHPAPPTGAAAPALLMYTSGSTAMPRAVVCPPARVGFAIGAIGARLGYTASDVVLNRIPVSFDYGLYQLFLCAAAGAQLVVRPDLAEAATLLVARACGATVLPIVPTLAAVLLRLRRPPRDLPVRLITNTGAALDAPTTAGLRALFPAARIVPMYGMTECKRITIAEPDEDLAHPGTVGRALDGTTVAVVDPGGAVVPSGVTGEIVVAGPHVMAGYWRSPEETARRFVPRAGGVALRTGDFGYLDAQGRLYFVGRRDDIFKRNGVRMSTVEIEAVIADVPGVRAAAVVPPGPDGTLTAYVVGTGDLTPTQVLGQLAARVEPARVPDRCVVLAELPTTTHGKIDRSALRERADVTAWHPATGGR